MTLAQAAARLAAAGVPTPRVDAELLLAHVLGVPRSRLVLAPPPDAAAQARFDDLVVRRADRTPLQHLTGTTPFRRIAVAVGPGVFVPRPETELLVDAVLPLAGGVVVDLCAGSGVLALAIADEAPATTCYAVESSADALVWLRRNVAGTTVTAVEGDVRDASVLRELDGRVDAVVSNPPYVPSTVEVDPEVRADPAQAVFAGADGLDLIPAVVARAAALLRPGGRFAMEHDDTHGSSVPQLLKGDGRWDDVAEHTDLTGRSRFVTARRADGHS